MEALHAGQNWRRIRAGMVEMKGIILAGGTGSRLRPLTWAVCKQLLPVHDKPMIYYPLSCLMLADIREVLVISTPHDLPLIRRLLGDGAQWGLSIAYASQPSPGGIAEALVLGEAFLDGASCALVLGDNLLYGEGLGEMLRSAGREVRGAHVFGYPVANPSRYGVLAFNEQGAVSDVVEKPASPPSTYAVPGLYFYDASAPQRASALRPSPRGELEITDLNRSYLSDGLLDVTRLGRGIAWLDMGTPRALSDAASFVSSLESRTGLKVGCPEEIAFRQGWISGEQLMAAAERHAGSDYGAYLGALLGEAP